MNIHEFAKILDGRQYCSEITEAEIQQAKDLGVVAIFGASDDLMEFRGAINDEIDCYNGGVAYLSEDGIFENNECSRAEDCRYYLQSRSKRKTIEAVWCGSSGFPWSYETDISHATFDIYEDGEKYCRGIVFNINDLQTQKIPCDQCRHFNAFTVQTALKNNDTYPCSMCIHGASDRFTPCDSKNKP